MADAGRRVDVTTDPVSNTDCDTLRFRSGITQTVDQWIASFRENLCSTPDPFLDRGRFTPDQATWPVLYLVVQEPGVSQHAGALGLDDPVSLDREVNIVTDAAAESTGGILDNLDFPGSRGVACSLHESRNRLCLFASFP